MSQSIRACVVGATGYAGIEAVRLLLRHPSFELAMATDRKLVGTKLAEVYPGLAGITGLAFSAPVAEDIAAAADVAFLAVPHTASLALTPALIAAGVSVIDLSADYRLKDVSVYEEWYGVKHTSPELLDEAVYGLPEHARKDLARLAEKRESGKAVLVAAPGCYPTATALASVPALEAGFVSGDLVISDAISGVTGAGRTPNARTHFCHADECVEAYGVAHHRHTPEMEQTLSAAARRPISVVFTPHLAPLKRGLLATVYLPMAEDVTADEFFGAYAARYEKEPLSRCCPRARCRRLPLWLAPHVPRWALDSIRDDDAWPSSPARSTPGQRALRHRQSSAQTPSSDSRKQKGSISYSPWHDRSRAEET